MTYTAQREESITAAEARDASLLGLCLEVFRDLCQIVVVMAFANDDAVSLEWVAIRIASSLAHETSCSLIPRRSALCLASRSTGGLESARTAFSSRFKEADLLRAWRRRDCQAQRVDLGRCEIPRCHRRGCGRGGFWCHSNARRGQGPVLGGGRLTAWRGRGNLFIERSSSCNLVQWQRQSEKLRAHLRC